MEDAYDMEMSRKMKERALKAGLPEVEILELIILAEQEIQNVAKKLGLPENSTMDVVHNAIINHDVQSLAEKMDLSVRQAEEYSIENQINRKLAEKLRLRGDASAEDIKRAVIDADRKQRTQKLGLPEDATDKQIREAIVRKSLGLPITATVEEVNEEYARRNRARLARELGLPETATTAELNEAMRREHDAELARKLGLPENATTAELNEAMRKEDDARLARKLGLPENATTAELNEAMRRRHRAGDIGRGATRGIGRADLDYASKAVEIKSNVKDEISK